LPPRRQRTHPETTAYPSERRGHGTPSSPDSRNRRRRHHDAFYGGWLLLTCRPAVGADFVLTVTGRFNRELSEQQSFSYLGIDGDVQSNVLPPLFDFDRLEGGTLRATYYFPLGRRR